MKLLISCVVANNANALITFNNLRRYVLDVDGSNFLSKSVEDRLKSLDLFCKGQMNLGNKSIKVLSYQIESDN